MSRPDDRHQGAYVDAVSLRNAESNNGKRGLWRVVFILALLVFIVSMTALGVIAFSYFQGQQKYGDVADAANVSDLGNILPEQTDAADVEKFVNVDWNALLAANPDTVAWVYIPGTQISYPVVRGADNEYYLTRDFDGEAGWLANYGAIFMDYRNNPNWTDQTYFIYGHNMNDGSMFADIVKMENQERFDASRTVYVLSPRGNFRLRTFALVHISPDAEVVTTQFGDDAQMLEYIQDKIANSVVTVGDIPDIASMRKIFAFATCDNESWGRDVLYAYVEDTSVSDLAGTIGIKSEDGSAEGFVEELEVEKSGNGAA